jgi:hypothetical protein
MPPEGTQHEAGVVRVAKNVKKKATEAMFPTSCQFALLLQLSDASRRDIDEKQTCASRELRCEKK